MTVDGETKKKDPVEPTPASTVVLMRPADETPFEVFFVKRHGKARFMANTFVFPGGRMDAPDKSETLEYQCRGFVRQELADRLGLELDDAIAYYITAFRELFEEAGALLATESNGENIDFENPAEAERYDTYRVMLQDDEVNFDQVVGWEDLHLRMDALVYFAHWITPEIESHRYDTRFFLAKAPLDQHLVHDDKETTASYWMSPAEALARYAKGEFLLAPPTVHTLDRLSYFGSIDDVLEHYGKADVPVVQPEPVFDDGALSLVVPGDPAYPDGEATPIDGPTRVTLIDEKWVLSEIGAPDEATKSPTSGE